MHELPTIKRIKLRFGPWTTTLHHASRLELSSFWRRRLYRLASLTGARRKTPLRSMLLLIGMICLLILLPRVRWATAFAEDATPTSAEKQATQVGQPLVATFSNGVKAQLIGLSSNPSKGQTWWAPNGRLLKEAPYARMNPVMQGDGVAREVCWRWINVPDDPDFETRWETEPHYRGAGVSAPLDAGGKKVTGLHAKAIHLPGSPDTFTLRLSASIRATPWSTVITTSGDGPSAMGRRLQDEPDAAAVFGRPLEVRNDTLITVTHQIPGRAVRLVAVDKNDRIHPASSADGAGASGFQQFTYQYAGLRPDQIERFDLQSQNRTFEVIEFRNVSLHAGKQTKVEIVHLPAEKP